MSWSHVYDIYKLFPDKEYLNFHDVRLPKLLYFDEQTVKYKWDSDVMTSETIADFVTRVQNGQVEPFFFSEDPPSTNDEHVKVVVGKTWKDEVLSSDK